MLLLNICTIYADIMQVYTRKKRDIHTNITLFMSFMLIYSAYFFAAASLASFAFASAIVLAMMYRPSRFKVLEYMLFKYKIG